MSPTYTTAATFKSNFGIPSDFTDDDTFIETLLETEEAIVEEKVGYTFGKDTDRIDEWNTRLRRVIIPPKVPIVSIDTLKIDTVIINSDYYDISEDAFFIWLDDDYDYCDATVEIYLKHTSGYDATSFPTPLKTAIYWRVGYEYAVCRTTVRKKASGLKGRFEGIKDLWEAADTIIERYKLHNVNPSGKIG